MFIKLYIRGSISKYLYLCWYIVKILFTMGTSIFFLGYMLHFVYFYRCLSSFFCAWLPCKQQMMIGFAGIRSLTLLYQMDGSVFATKREQCIELKSICVLIEHHNATPHRGSGEGRGTETVIIIIVACDDTVSSLQPR